MFFHSDLQCPAVFRTQQVLNVRLRACILDKKPGTLVRQRAGIWTCLWGSGNIQRPLLASLGVGEGPCTPQNARRDEHTGTGPRAWDWTMTTWSLSAQREDSWIGHKDTYVPVTATLMEQLAVCFRSICSIDAETDSFRTRQRSDAVPSPKTHKGALSPQSENLSNTHTHTFFHT